MVRIILGVVAGIVTAMVVTFLIEAVGHSLFPVAGPLAMDDPGYLDAVPLPAKLCVLVAWFVASLAGGYVANRIAQVRWPCWVIAGLMVVGAIASFTQFPHPTWMIAGGLLLPLVAAWIVARRPQGAR